MCLKFPLSLHDIIVCHILGSKSKKKKCAIMNCSISVRGAIKLEFYPENYYFKGKIQFFGFLDLFLFDLLFHLEDPEKLNSHKRPFQFFQRQTF